MKPRVPLLKRPVIDADRYADETRTACAKAMVCWLKSINVDRSIRSLKIGEMECLAEAVISTWIVRESQRPGEPEYDEARADRAAEILLG